MMFKHKITTTLVSLSVLLTACATSSTYTDNELKSTKTKTTPYKTIDITNPADNIEAWIKMDGDISGREYYRMGSLIAYGQPKTEFSQQLFEMVSLRKAAYKKLPNGDYASQYWACAIYANPATGEYIDEYKNPYTKEVITLKPYCSNISGSTYSVKEGLKSRANFSMQSTVFNKPYLMDWRITGDTVVVNRPASTIWQEKSTGKTKVESTVDTYIAKLSDLQNPTLTSVDSTYQYTLTTEWMSMLKMGDIPGSMLWVGNSTKHFDVNEIPESVKEAFKQRLGDDFLAKPLVWDEEVK